MALDGVFLNSIKKELEATLIGSRVDKIHQPSREEIVIAFRSKQGNFKLVLSTSAGTSRVHITKSEIENPTTPPMFCMLLRKHLVAGRLVEIRQDGFERILHFDFDSANEMGDICRLTLAIEIMGRCSNLILIDGTGKVIDSIKRVNSDMSSVRMVLPGMMYSLPPRDNRLLINDFNFDEVISRLNNNSNLELSKAILKTFEGISPIFARECAFYTTRGEETIVSDLNTSHFDRLKFYLNRVKEQINTSEYDFTILKDKNNQLKDFCFTTINQYGHLMITQNENSASELLDNFYSSRDLQARMKQKSQDMFKFLLSTIERISRRISVQRQELEDCKGREQLRVYGDLLSANIYRLQKGMSVVKVENYLEPDCPLLEIKLDKRLTPSQNAQKYFVEYRKLDIAEKKLSDLIEKGENELLYIESVFDALTRATTESEVQELRDELVEQGYLKAKKIKGSKPKPSSPLKYKSTDGYTILVGRNNKQNDKLTLKDSDKSDVWLHTQNITGSHVVIKCNGDEPTERTIYEAAIIAAYNSKGVSSAQVPVDYTLIKFVKKPVGAKPGMVIFTNNKTLFVKPDEEIVKSLSV